MRCDDAKWNNIWEWISEISFLSPPRDHQGRKVEPPARPLPDWRPRRYSGWHVDGRLPHGHTTHTATKVSGHRLQVMHRSLVDICGSMYMHPCVASKSFWLDGRNISLLNQRLSTHQFSSLGYKNNSGKIACPYLMDTVGLLICKVCVVALRQSHGPLGAWCHCSWLQFKNLPYLSNLKGAILKHWSRIPG